MSDDDLTIPLSSFATDLFGTDRDTLHLLWFIDATTRERYVHLRRVHSYRRREAIAATETDIAALEHHDDHALDPMAHSPIPFKLTRRGEHLVTLAVGIVIAIAAWYGMAWIVNLGGNPYGS